MNKFFWIVVAAFTGLIMSSCGVGKVVQQAGGTYDQGIKAYQDAMKFAANFRLTVDTETGKMNTVVTMTNSYMVSDVEKVKQYRAKMADAYGQLNNMDKQYPAPQSNQPVDLSKLQASGALPNNMYSGFSLYANVITEAPVASVPTEITTTSMSIVTGAYDHINAAGIDWNNAVDAYNTWRRSVSTGSRIIADVANYFGVENLPDSLPYYGGGSGSTGSGGIPTPALNPVQFPTP